MLDYQRVKLWAFSNWRLIPLSWRRVLKPIGGTSESVLSLVAALKLLRRNEGREPDFFQTYWHLSHISSDIERCFSLLPISQALLWTKLSWGQFLWNLMLVLLVEKRIRRSLHWLHLCIWTTWLDDQWSSFLQIVDFQRSHCWGSLRVERVPHNDPFFQMFAMLPTQSPFLEELALGFLPSVRFNAVPQIRINLLNGHESYFPSWTCRVRPRQV